MSVRVDRVWQRTQGGWGWEIKGFKGQGLYVQLATNEIGRGLFVIEWSMGRPGECILGVNLFDVPEQATREQAVEALERALVSIGWGPVVRDGHSGPNGIADAEL